MCPVSLIRCGVHLSLRAVSSLHRQHLICALASWMGWTLGHGGRSVDGVGRHSARAGLWLWGSGQSRAPPRSCCCPRGCGHFPFPDLASNACVVVRTRGRLLFEGSSKDLE